MSGYNDLGLELVEPLQNRSSKSRRPPMLDENKDDGARNPIKILLEEYLERQRNGMRTTLPRSFNNYPRLTHIL